MKVPSIKLIFDRKKVATHIKEASVEFLICHEYKKKYIATGVRLHDKEWKPDLHVVGRVDAPELNELLNKQIRNVREVINRMMDEGNINIDEIPSRLLMLNRDGMSFMEFCEERVAIRQHGLKEDSAERYDRFMKFFRSWGKIVYFADVTDKNVIAMDEALSQKKMSAYSRWHNYHRFLNSFIIDAVNEGRLSRNPYKWVPIVRSQEKKTLDKFLTAEEFERIKNLPLNGHLERARDLFVFQVYTCLAYVDLAAFDANNIIVKNGKKMYVGKRGKTGQEYSFLIMDEALDILEKYGGKLPIITNQKYNDYLKLVAAFAKIEKPLSTHYARHTGATLLLNAGVDMEIVAKILGHSSTRITRQVYAKLLDETVADAMEKVKGKI